MNSRNTRLWFLLAAGLAAVIWFLNHHFQPGIPAAYKGWPDLQLTDATSIEVIPAGALEIRADRTNDTWFLSKPFIYPAQKAAIQALLQSLSQLTPATRITAGELRAQPTAEEDYGFDNPQVSLIMETRSQQWHLVVGRRTAPGDQVFLRVVGVDGAFVTDAAWLKYLPHNANDWRETSLVDSEGIYDWIVLTNGPKAIELHLDPTNHLWRMTRPLQARADTDRINTALEQLRTAKVESFVTDDPAADLSAYQLQPANLDLWLGHKGILSEGLHTGKTLTNNPALVFAKREGWNGVITALGEPLSVWHGTVNDFRSPHLVELTSPISEIEVHVSDPTNHYTLQRVNANAWSVLGEPFPVDAANVQEFIKLVGGLRSTEFVKDVVTAPDLQTYGLTHPYIQVTFHSPTDDTNLTPLQLSFSAPLTNGVFVRRSDEDFIYRLDPSDLNRIPQAGWEFRERRIWSYPEQDIAEITVRQNGRTRVIQHKARNQWILAPGSPGQVYGPTIEEAAHELGELSAIGWVGHKISRPDAFGVNSNSLQIEVTLKDRQKFTLDMGGAIAGEPLALVTLNDDQWAFILPASLYQLILSYLTIPANVP